MMAGAAAEWLRRERKRMALTCRCFCWMPLGHTAMCLLRSDSRTVLQGGNQDGQD